MCIQDWQLGRLIRAVPRVVALSAAPMTLATRNKDRVAIEFSIAILNQVTVAPDVDDITAGYQLNGKIASTGILSDVQGFVPCRCLFALTTHGDLPMHNWLLCSGSDTGLNMLVVEYILPEEVLSLTPEELRQRAR